MNVPTEGGIALYCRADGTVIRVVHDDLGFSPRTPPGTPLSALVDPAAEDKLNAFAEAVREHGASFDWEIIVPIGVGPTDKGLMSLHFAGVRTDEGMLVVAARTRSALVRIHEKMSRINNEQANAIRAMSKELVTVSSRNRERDDAVFEDLTRVNNDLANLQREMARKNTELSMLNEEKNRLLGIAAHDLRSPLGVILTYSEFLENEAAQVLDSEQREFVSVIRTTSQFMLQLLDDILDVSQIEAGQLNLDLQPTDVVALLRRNLGLNRVLAARKQIELRFQPEVETLQLTVDAAKIEQILNNLIGNAIKFSPPRTRVDVRLGVNGRSVTIMVADQGPGIPLADLPKLFKPFSKTSVRPTGGEKSTGLGLAIVRRIAEGHGGEIHVESEVGHGCRFIFSLPKRGPDERGNQV